MPQRHVTPSAAVLAVVAGLTLAACAPSAHQDTYSFGKNLGCRSGYADAGWVHERHWPIPANASQDFKRGWQDGYGPCLAYGLDNPRPGERP